MNILSTLFTGNDIIHFVNKILQVQNLRERQSDEAKITKEICNDIYEDDRVTGAYNVRV